MRSLPTVRRTAAFLAALSLALVFLVLPAVV